jgi:hypothetical protein
MLWRSTGPQWHGFRANTLTLSDAVHPACHGTEKMDGETSLQTNPTN